MCDQSEITYLPNEIVWVKLGPVWWPGEVQDYNTLPQEITANLRKQPIAVVKFFQEDSYEYIKNLNHIYRYNCLKKNEFIKKGLDLCRSANVRDVPSNMKMFPEDVVTAEKRTGGNPNILQSDQFVPQEKKSYNELFGTPKRVKEGKEGTVSGRKGRPPSETKVSVKSQRSASPATPSLRAITHPRFVGHSNTPDYESRVRQQPPPDSESNPPNLYKCHVCDFSTVRLNVIVLHNKSHTGTNVNFSPKNKEVVKKLTPRVKASTPKIKQTGEAPKRKLVAESPSVPKKANLGQTSSRKETEKQSPVSVPPAADVKPAPKKRGPKPTKTDKLAKVIKENEMIRDDLLKDWDDEDEMAEEEEKSKQFEETQSPGNEKEDENADQNAKISEEGNEKTKEKSCFDFDDSEDNVTSNKKPASFSRKTSTVVSDGPSVSAHEKKVDLELEEMGKEVDDLLSETKVPELPDVKLSRASSKKQSEPFELDDNDAVNVNESKSVDLSVADGNSSATDTKMVDGSHSYEGEQNLTRGVTVQSTNQTDESKLTQKESDVKSLPSTQSLVIDYDSKPIRQRRRSSQSKLKSPVVADCSTNSDAFASTEVTSSESVAAFEHQSEPAETFNSTNPITMAAEPISAQENIVKEVDSVAVSMPSHITSCKIEPADGVSSSSDQIITELVPTVKEEMCPNEVLSTSCAEVNMNVAEGTTRGTGKRGRPPGPRQTVSRRGMPQPIAASTVTSTRRRSTSKKVDNAFIMSTSLKGQEIEVNSSSAVNLGQEIIIKEETKPVSSVTFNISSTNSPQLSDRINVLPESVIGETVVVGGDLLLNPGQPVEVNSGQSAVGTNCSLDFDSMPIFIDNDEYAPSSAGYEKVETAQAISSTPLIEIAPSVVPVKIEPKTETTTIPSSFLEKALIQSSSEFPPSTGTPSLVPSEPKLFKLKPTVSAVSKRMAASKTEKGSAAKSILPVQTSSGSMKPRTLKLPSSIFSQNSKNTNQIVLLKTSSGQLVKSPQIIQQDGKVIILTPNQGQRSGLVVKNIKGEQFLSGKLTSSRITPKKVISEDYTEGASSSKQIPNILNKAGGESSKSKTIAIAPGSSQGVMRQKIIGHLSQANSSAKKVIISSNKQLLNSGLSKVILSKASASGTKLVMHTSQKKVNVPPALTQKFLVSGGSQASALTPSLVKLSTPSSISVQGSSSKVMTPVVSATPTVVTTPKVVKLGKQGPNILQKHVRKPTKTLVAALPTKVVSTATPSAPSSALSVAPANPIAEAPTTSETVASRSSTGMSNVVYVAMDNNTYQAVDSSLLTFDGSQQPTQTLYINPGTTNLENLMLTIDEKGNMNLSQQAPQLFTNEVAAPTQDILAKALADTQVLQTEASIADAASRVAYIEPLPYPAPLISNVQETSLTLNQPIMTPLEQPSSVTPTFSLIPPEQSSDPVKSSSRDMFITQMPDAPPAHVAYQITVDDMAATSSVELNQIPSSNSLETSIDEDLIKINKPSKSRSVKSKPLEEERYVTETVLLENKNELDASKFIISAATSSDSPLQPSFVDSKGTVSDVLPDTLSVSSNGQNELIISNESSDFGNDRCDMKVEVREGNCILETEIVNGLGADSGENSSTLKITKDLDFSCQESEKNPETLLTPSDPLLHIHEG